MERWQVTFIFSCLFSLFFVEIPPFSLVILGSTLLLYLLSTKQWLKSAVILAICGFSLHALWLTHWHLPSHQIKKPLIIIGVVSNIPSVTRDNIRFNLKVSQLDQQKYRWFERPVFKLSQQTDRQITAQTTAQTKKPQNLQLGDTVKLTAKLKPAHGFANQGGFSYQKWLLLQGIRATGYVVNSQPLTIVEPSSSYRQRVFDKLKTATAGQTYQGLLMALTMGEKQFITADQWQTIKATGISHLLAISGLHIGVVFLLTSLLAKVFIKGGVFIINKELNAPLIALFFGLLGALIYAWLAGFAIPTRRALLMLTILVLMLLRRKVINSKSVILITLTLLLLFQPLTILAPGLWLSFIAVIVIITTFWWLPTTGRPTNVLHQLFSYCRSVIKMQMALFVFLVPVTIIVFNGFSLSSGIVNLIAVPWVSFVTVPVSLIAALLAVFGLPSEVLFSIADGSLSLLFDLIEFSSAKSGWIAVKHIPWYSWGLLMISILSLLLRLSIRFRLLSLLPAIPALLYMLPPTADNWRIDILDVGQGLSVVIEKNNKALVYDLGPTYKSGFNTVDHVVLPFLTYRGHQAVDYLVISHADSDHAGAYKKFFASVTAEQTIAPLQLIPDATACDAKNFDWQGLTVEVMWPIKAVSLPTNSNDSSCVIRVSNGRFSILMPGDISTRVERQLIKHYGQRLQSTVLVAPHHGSNSSSSPAFIATVKPQYVIYSSGFLNRYQFPRAKVVARYADAVQLNTADSGQLSFTLTESQLDWQQARTDLMPQWFYNQ